MSVREEENISLLPPTDNGDEVEMGELTESEVQSISASVDKENFNSINFQIKQDNKPVNIQKLKNILFCLKISKLIVTKDRLNFYDLDFVDYMDFFMIFYGHYKFKLFFQN